MEIFRDLIVTATADQMAAVVANIEAAQPADWSVNTALNTQLSNISYSHKRPRVYFFSLSNAARPKLTLALAEMPENPSKYFVPNIVPEKPPMLTRGEYNAALEEFEDCVFRPAAVSAGVSFQLTDSQAELEDWLSKDAAEKLRKFSATANRLVGAALTSDRAMWNAFVLAAHKERSSLDTATLKRWLVEVDRWDVDVAEQLASEYDYDRELLGFSTSRGGI